MGAGKAVLHFMRKKLHTHKRTGLVMRDEHEQEQERTGTQLDLLRNIALLDNPLCIVSI